MSLTITPKSYAYDFDAKDLKKKNITKYLKKLQIEREREKIFK